MGIYVHDLRSKKKWVRIHNEADVKMRTSNLYLMPYQYKHGVANDSICNRSATWAHKAGNRIDDTDAQKRYMERVAEMRSYNYPLNASFCGWPPNLLVLSNDFENLIGCEVFIYTGHVSCYDGGGCLQAFGYITGQSSSGQYIVKREHSEFEVVDMGDTFEPEYHGCTVHRTTTHFVKTAHELGIDEYPYPYSATHLVHSSDYEEVWFRDGFKIKEPLTAAELREKNQPIWQV